MDDAEGIAARLDAEIQAAVDAYVDPWQEAVTPVHPAQFVSQFEAATVLHQIQGLQPAYGD